MMCQGANQTGHKRSRAGRPLHTCILLCNVRHNLTRRPLHTCVERVVTCTMQTCMEYSSRVAHICTKLKCTEAHDGLECKLCITVQGFEGIALQGRNCIAKSIYRTVHCSALQCRGLHSMRIPVRGDGTVEAARGSQGHRFMSNDDEHCADHLHYQDDHYLHVDDHLHDQIWPSCSL